MSSLSSRLRSLPAIDALIRSTTGQDLTARFSHSLVVEALRASLAQARADIQSGLDCPSSIELLQRATQLLNAQQQSHLRPLINATGVIINTNLGRAPLSDSALTAVQEVAHGYSNLEYDLEAGERGSRHSHVRALLRELTGAEAALVTNNNAAAVLLALSTLATGREVIISRGQLVEIGGGFRVPDVMVQSGCQLVEVGTTNRTRIRDYEQAITDRTALLLSVHPSNFRVLGFTESTSINEITTLAQRHNLLVMDDLGSGCLLKTEDYGLSHEPRPQDSLAAGVDIVCFSGDKLLGGPQAGILVGKAPVIERLARHPLMRAVRVDKMTLAALEATLQHYRRNEATSHIPIWRMISMPLETITARAMTWKQHLQQQRITAQVISGESTIGGGSLPSETLPTRLLAVTRESIPSSSSLDDIAQHLRQRPLPIITRIAHNMLLFDPRTILPEQDEQLQQALIEVIGQL